MKTLLDSKLAKMKEGTLFFISDIDETGDNAVLRKQLSRKVQKGELVRYPCGIYHYPRKDTKYNLGTIPATNEEIAKAYSRKHSIKLYPTREAAMNILGLSTQNQLNTVYLTNGCSKTINTGKGNGIRFIHVENHNLEMFKSQTMLRVAIALQGMKKTDISDKDIAILKQHISSIPAKHLQNDVKYLKKWQYSLLMK